MPTHVIVAQLQDKRRYRIFGTLDDKHFERIAAVTVPQGWQIFHIEDGELNDSPRVAALRRLPCTSAVTGVNAAQAICEGMTPDELLADKQLRPRITAAVALNGLQRQTLKRLLAEYDYVALTAIQNRAMCLHRGRSFDVLLNDDGTVTKVS